VCYIENPHLCKAALRSPKRPLSALSTNLSTNLLRLLSSPEFLNLAPAPTIHVPNTNPTQPHALAPANFARELFEVFDELGLGLDSDARGGGLKSTSQASLFIATRIIHPLVAGIKAELPSLIEALEVPALMCTPKVATYSKTVSTQYPSIIALQGIIQVHARALTRHFPTTSIQSHLASLEISVVWRALVALAHRTPSHLTPPSSPNLTLTGVNGKRGAVLWAPHHQPHPHRRDFISSSHHLVLPPLHFRKPSCHLSSVTPELYAVCFPH